MPISFYTGTALLRDGTILPPATHLILQSTHHPLFCQVHQANPLNQIPLWKSLPLIVVILQNFNHYPSEG